MESDDLLMLPNKVLANTRLQEVMLEILREITKQQMQELFNPVLNDIHLILSTEVYLFIIIIVSIYFAIFFLTKSTGFTIVYIYLSYIVVSHCQYRFLYAVYNFPRYFEKLLA